MPRPTPCLMVPDAHLVPDAVPAQCARAREGAGRGRRDGRELRRLPYDEAARRLAPPPGPAGAIPLLGPEELVSVEQRRLVDAWWPRYLAEAEAAGVPPDGDVGYVDKLAYLDAWWQQRRAEAEAARAAEMASLYARLYEAVRTHRPEARRVDDPGEDTTWWGRLGIGDKIALVADAVSEGLLEPLVDLLRRDPAEVVQEVCRALDPETLAAMAETAWGGFLDLVRALLDDIMPLGFGAYAGGGATITWGIPLMTGAEVENRLSRPELETIRLWTRAVGTVGLDTGVGAGVFSGRTDGGRGGQEGSLGLSLSAGAEATAGVEATVIREFDFPLFDDAAFSSLLLSLSGVSSGAVFQILQLISPLLDGLDPARYRTKSHDELQGFGQASAAASAGLRRRGKGTAADNATQRWTKSEGAPDLGKDDAWWLRWLSHKLSASIRAQAGVTVETEVTSWGADERGNREPETVDVEIAGEGQLMGALNLPLPPAVLVPPVALLPTAVDRGFGVKASWDDVHLADLPGALAEREPDCSIYTLSGDLDVYSGPASELALELGDGGGLEAVEEVVYKRRIGLAAPVGRTYVKTLQQQPQFKTLMKAEHRDAGFDAAGYLDVEIVVGASDLQRIVAEAKALASAASSLTIREAYDAVVAFLDTGVLPEALVHARAVVLDVLKGAVRRVHAHLECGLGVAAGARLSGGVKGRIEGQLHGGMTFDQDLTHLEHELDALFGAQEAGQGVRIGDG